MSSLVTHDLETLLAAEPVDLARLALVVARIESPALDPSATLAELTRIGHRAAEVLARLGDAPVRQRVSALNRVLFDLERFQANHARYDDLRNSLLHMVVEQRAGIPITLAVIYMSVARTAGLEIFGVSFPGHFLMRVPNDPGDHNADVLILDPFDDGRVLDRGDLKDLLAVHAGGDAPWSDTLLAPCTSRQIVVRLLNNLKRLYVGMRCFHQAWQVTDALVTIGGRDPEDVRDRGLLAYHLDDFPAALADLEAYVQITGTAREGSDDRAQLWEHLSTLRRRVAAMN